VGGHEPGKPGKVREFDSGQKEKSGNVEKVRKMCFACGVLPQFQWSQNKRSLTA